MKIASILAVLCLSVSLSAQAPNDVPRDHWAYSAVNNLAGKGLIKGYPPDGNFWGQRVATRYEFASIISRVIQYVDDTYAKKVDVGKPAPGVAPEQLEEVRRLVNEFKTELVVIGADLKRLQDQIGDLSKEIAGVRKTAEQAASDAAATRKEIAAANKDLKDVKESTDKVKGRVSDIEKNLRVHKVSGYIQARFDAIDVGRTSLFTNSGAGGTGINPANGGPAVGGPFYGFQVRRARLKISGPVSKRSDYTLQFDGQSGNAVGVYDANINVADLPVKRVSGRLGMFPPVFGYELPTSSAVRESPERAFAWGSTLADYPIFKTNTSATGGTLTPGSVIPLFLSQNRDVGAAFQWDIAGKGNSKTLATLSAINGEGRSANGVRNSNNGVDLLGRIEAPFLKDTLKVGLSGYFGTLAVRGGPPVGNPAVPVGFVNADRILGGADIRWQSPWGTSFRAEYVGGIFETTPDRSQFLKGNHAQAWYLVARQPLTRKLEFVAKYDEFNPIAQGGISIGGLDRSDYSRKSLGGGLLYSLDEATRLRLWYVKGLSPYDPSASSGPLRSRLGLITGEVQVSF